MIHRLYFTTTSVLPIEQVRLSPGQSGLMSGWGLFTTMRIVERIPFAFERHWKRLSRDAERIALPVSVRSGAAFAGRWAKSCARTRCEKAARASTSSTTRPSFWRSDEDFPPADLLICSSDLPAASRCRCASACASTGATRRRRLAGVKVTSWLNNVWNLYEAQQAGFDEVVLLNERGEVAECTAANIFCVRDGRVLTPPLSSGCLAGVTRGIVLEIGPRAGVPVEERTLFPEDLYSADEVFISSTNRNVIAVASEQSPAGQMRRSIGGRRVMRKLEAHSVLAALRSRDTSSSARASRRGQQPISAPSTRKSRSSRQESRRSTAGPRLD